MTSQRFTHAQQYSGGISAPFIHRPAGTSLLMVAVLLVGIIAYRFLPVAPLPRVDFPVINVSASLPGADPETMAASVAAPLERRFGEIAGVSELTSVSTLGSTNITIMFALDLSIDKAARDVQAAIMASLSQLPPNLPSPPYWRKSNPADAPILILALTSDLLSPGKLYDAAFDILAQRISQVSGVSQVIISGAQKSAVRVRVNPTLLASMDLGFEDVKSLLVNANANGPKGSFDGPSSAYMVGCNDQLFNATQYEPLILRSKNGTVVRLSSVASVVNSVVDTRVAAWFNQKPAVLVIIFKQPNANIIETVDLCQEQLKQIQRWMPPAAVISTVADRTSTIRASVEDVQRALMISIVLVVTIVFLFLRRLWSTFAAALTVPLALTGTFAGMYLCGYTLDNLSLMALAVAVGFVVDDAIVMIENVSRRAEAGDGPLQAALTGARQIGFTVVSISVSLIAVFIPLLFMGGLMGRLFHEFAVTLTIAIAVSMIVSLTVTPMICAYLAPAHKHGGGAKPLGWFDRIGEGAFNGMLDLYRRALDVVLRHPNLTLAVTIATLLGTVCLYAVVPKSFFPRQDTGRLMAQTEGPTDISFQAMFKRQQAINRLLLKNPDVQNVGSFIGGQMVNTGRAFIALNNLGEGRKHRIDEVIQDLMKEAEQVRGIKLFLVPVPDVRMGGRLSKSEYQYTLSDVDINELNSFASKLLARLQGNTELLLGVTTDAQPGGPVAKLAIDRVAASRLGIAPQDIDAALYDAFGQEQVSIIYTNLDQYRVILEVDPALQEDPAALSKIYVQAADGAQVPLANVTHLERTHSPLAVNHSGQFPSVTLSFGLPPGASLGEATDYIESTMKELHPPERLRAFFQGTAQAFQESLSSESWLIATAIIAIYIILGVLYESLIHPITILSTIPSAGIGALLALMAFRLPLDVMGLIGIILLIGIVKKNAIMMIDFALEAERERGLDTTAAIREAALLRFRPIMMTTMSALLGDLPLALGHATGSEMRRPLGIAIVGGLIFSQALTLFTTPVVYIFLDRLRMFWAGKDRHSAAKA